MFVVFGTKGVTTTQSTGRFACPRCMVTRDYRLVSTQRHVHVFFVSIFAMDSPVEYVECRHCRATYVPEVLRPLTKARTGPSPNAEFEKAVVRVMIAVARADRFMDADEERKIRQLFHDIAGRPLTTTFLNEQLSVVQKWGFDVDKVVRDVRPRLNDHGRELVLRSAVYVAMADGRLHKRESGLLQRIARSLEMTQTHSTAVLREAGLW